MKKIRITLLFSMITFVLFSQKQTNSSFSAEAKKIAKEKIEGYRLRVIKGESMKTLVVLYSEDPGSAANGGMYYNVKKGVMDPVFESVAFSLKQGQISPVFETVYGYHFIQLVQRKGDLLDLMHILIVPKKK